MNTVETRIKEPTFLGDSLLKALIFCLYNPDIRDGGSVSTVETRIKEPTFLGDRLLKALIFCLYNPYIRDGESASLIKTCKDCIFIPVAFSPIIYFIFKAIFVKILC